MAILAYGLVTNGFADGKGMAAIVIMLYSAILALVSIVLSIISNILHKNEDSSKSVLPKFGLISGVVVLLIIGALIGFDVSVN